MSDGMKTDEVVAFDARVWRTGRPTCDPPAIHVYLKGARACQCGQKVDRVLTLAESDWLKLLADDPRAVPPGQEVRS